VCCRSGARGCSRRWWRCCHRWCTSRAKRSPPGTAGRARGRPPARFPAGCRPRRRACGPPGRRRAPGACAPGSAPARRGPPPRRRRGRCARPRARPAPLGRTPSASPPGPPPRRPAGPPPAVPGSSAGSSRGRSAAVPPARSPGAARAPPGAGIPVSGRSWPHRRGGTASLPATRAAVQRCSATSGRCWHTGGPAHGPPAMKTSYPRKDIHVLLLEGVSPSAVEVFREAGYSSIETHAGSLAGPALAERIREAHIVGIRSRTQLTAEVLAEARRLMAVGCFCIGANQVDLAAAAPQGVPVYNATYSNSSSEAKLVLAEVIMLMRGLPASHAACRRGDWLKSATGSREVRGKTLGIVGYGHIGTQVGLLAEALGMHVVFHDIESKLSLGNARAAAGLDDLLARADVVTLHVPETPSTRLMIGAGELA